MTIPSGCIVRHRAVPPPDRCPLTDSSWRSRRPGAGIAGRGAAHGWRARNDAAESAVVGAGLASALASHRFLGCAVQPFRHRRYTRLLLLVVLAAIGAATPVLAQERSRLHLGGGVAIAGSLREMGGLGMAEVSARPGSLLDFRGAVSVAVGRFRSSYETIVGVDALGVVAPGSATRPYLGAGWGYSYALDNITRTYTHDLGVSLAAGIQRERWSTEVRLRSFGSADSNSRPRRTLVLFSVRLPVR